jgi:hypothetical protein
MTNFDNISQCIAISLFFMYNIVMEIKKQK